MNKTPLITAILTTACAATTPSVKKPEIPTETPPVQVSAEQTQTAIAAIYESARGTCSKARQQLADDRMEKIDSCACESERNPHLECLRLEEGQKGEKCMDIKDEDQYVQCITEVGYKADQVCASHENESPREKCFRAKGVPLQDEDYDPIWEESEFEQRCLAESASKSGTTLEQAKTAYKTIQATKLSYNHKALLVRDLFSKEEAQEYIEFTRAMHNERIFYDEKIWETLAVDNMEHLYEHYFQDVADVFRSQGYDKEAEALEQYGDVIKFYYGAPEQFLQPSKITESFIRGGLINAPPPPECEEERKK